MNQKDMKKLTRALDDRKKIEEEILMIKKIHLRAG
jgi:hypothetical protein